MDQLVLEKLIKEKKSIRDIASVLNVSATTVRYWLSKFDQKTDSQKPYRCKCGEINPDNFYGNKKGVCSKCHNESVMRLGKEKRKFAIELLGGKCANPECGYQRFLCALDVHHLNPKKKDPNFASMRGWSEKRIVKELSNCQLLCKCCHAAVHAKELSL